jgi:predicted nuclease of predicted toxin-antitoxin system
MIHSPGFWRSTVLFVADENLKLPIVEALRRNGHEVYSIYESARGLTNGEVLALANRLGGVLISADKDMGELVARQRRPAVGVVLVRLPDARLSDLEQAELVTSEINRLGSGLLGALTVLKPEGTRVRALQPQQQNGNDGPEL